MGVRHSASTYPSVPALWNDKCRGRVRQMQYLCVSVMVGTETMEHQDIDEILKIKTREEIMDDVEAEREENLLIVEYAIDELCNVLEMSNRLRDIHIVLCDIGHQSLRTGQEHRVLKPFHRLKNLRSVTTLNVPENFTQALQKTMKRKWN